MKNHLSVDWLITQMKIVGGVERYVFWLACEFASRGWDIRVITIATDHDLSDQLRAAGVSVYSLSAKSKWDLSVWYRLEQIWKQKKPTILHTHLYHAGILGRLVGKKMGIPIILCHQGGPEENRSFLRSLLDSCTSSLVDRYIVPCQSVETILHHREKIPLKKIHRIPNGIPLFYREKPPFTENKQTWNVPLRLITVGRLVYEKAQDILLESAYILAMRNFDIEVQIVGDGPLRSHLQNQIKRLNLTESVSLLGYHEHPQERLAQADIFVLPSRWEGFSLALMEAMSLALPLIATATGGTPELVSHLETGYLIPPNSALALADAVEFIYHHPDLAFQMGKQAQKRIFENYTISKVADQLENYYLKLSGKSPLP